MVDLVDTFQNYGVQPCQGKTMLDLLKAILNIYWKRLNMTIRKEKKKPKNWMIIWQVYHKSRIGRTI